METRYTQQVPQASVSKILSIEKAVNIEKVASEQILRMEKGRHKQEGCLFQAESLHPNTCDHTADQNRIHFLDN